MRSIVLNMKTNETRRRARALWMLLMAGMGLLSASASEKASGSSTERYVSYAFTVQNTTDQLISEMELRVCAPMQATCLQERLELKASHPYTEQRDQLGNDILTFSFSQIPPYAATTIQSVAC